MGTFELGTTAFGLKTSLTKATVSVPANAARATDDILLSAASGTGQTSRALANPGQGTFFRGLKVSGPRSTGALNAVTGRATPIPLHDTTAPWYRYVSPRYEGRISVVTEGRTPQQIARTYSHELQHVSDFVNHPQITHLVARKDYFPGTGLARYALEVRGYHAGGTLASPLTPLRSFSNAQKAYLGYDIIIFGVGGSAAAHSVYDTCFDGE